MTFFNIEKDINFEDNELNCIISAINGIEINICNVELKFQKNRTIIFTIYSSESIFRDEIKNIKGTYFNYNFFATILENGNNDFSMLSNQYVYIIDLIEFSKNDNFFINSKIKSKINMIPSKNFSDYIDDEIKRKNYTCEKQLEEFLKEKNINQIDFSKDREFISRKNIIELPMNSYIIDDYVVDIKILNKDGELANLFHFQDITYEEYNSKLKYIMQLYSLVYGTPILIEKVFIDKAVLYQSQSFDARLIDRISNKNFFYRNNHFTISLYKYLDVFLSFKNSDSLLDILLIEYFLSEVFSGNDIVSLNDISGFIDLFDGIFFKLKVDLENINNSKSQRDALDRQFNLKQKIDYILEKIEPQLKKYKIDDDNNTAELLSNFRHDIRHQLNKNVEIFKNSSKKQKIYEFSHGVLKLYIISHILKIDSCDYNLYRMLSDLNIYPLVKHVYKYLDKEIVIYNTQIKENYMNKVLTDNTTYFLTLKENNEFKNTKAEDFIYDDTQTEELDKIYIDKEDKLRNAILFNGVIVYNNEIIKSDKYHNFIGNYEDFQKLYM